MTVHNPARYRGFAIPRADGSNPMALLEQIQRTFAEFREKNDGRLTALERGREDVVTNEHVDRINAAISELTASFNAQSAELDALRLNGGGGQNALSAEARQHATAFNNWFRRGDGAAEASLRELEVSASLTTQSDPDGGYLVPREMDQTIVRVLAVVSAMRGIARVITTGSGDYSTLISQGGTTAGWVGEEDTRANTATSKLAKITIESGELYANPATTQTALSDAFFDVAQWLADEISISFAEQEGWAFILGDGKNKPRGILSYPTVINDNYAWGKVGFKSTGAAAGFAATAPTDALVDLYYSLKAGYRNGASWITSDAVLGQIRKFKDGQNNYIWAPPTADMPGTILGKPVITDDNMPQLGNAAFPVAFGNFQRAYLITDRAGTQVLRDPFTNKPYVQFYTTKRVGGGIVNYEALKLLKCSA